MLSVHAQQGKQLRHVADLGMVSNAGISRQTAAVHPDNGHPRVLRTGQIGIRFITHMREFHGTHLRTPAGLLEHAWMGFGHSGGGSCEGKVKQVRESEALHIGIAVGECAQTEPVWR